MIPVLVLNAGSSSLRYQLLDMDERSVVASGLVERIGEGGNGRITHRTGGAEPLVDEGPIPDVGAVASSIARRSTLPAAWPASRGASDTESDGSEHG